MSLVRRTKIRYIALERLLELGAIEFDNGVILSKPFRAGGDSDERWPMMRFNLTGLQSLLTSSWNFSSAFIVLFGLISNI